MEKNQVPYNEELDFAVMHHDIVYDNQPEKEKRSAEFMLKLYPNRTEAAEIIMVDKEHEMFYNEVLVGIGLTIQLAKAIKDVK